MGGITREMDVRTSILIQPIGYVEEFILEELVQLISESIEADVILSSTRLPPNLALYDWNRGQYKGELVLDWINKITSNYSFDRILGICGFDAYAGNLNFIFGIASMYTGKCLVFLHRLRSEHRLYVQRTLKESLHELGHTFGLHHCVNKRCVMSFSNSILDVDYKSHLFCSSCMKILERAVNSIASRWKI